MDFKTPQKMKMNRKPLYSESAFHQNQECDKTMHCKRKSAITRSIVCGCIVRYQLIWCTLSENTIPTHSISSQIDIFRDECSYFELFSLVCMLALSVCLFRYYAVSSLSLLLQGILLKVCREPFHSPFSLPSMPPASCL